MTRHPWSVRLLRACLALWFILAGGEPGLAHGCPMHDQAAGGAHVHGMATMHGHHAATHGAAHPPGDDTSAPAGSHVCTCVGACSAAAAVASLGNAPALQLDAPVVHAVQPLPDARAPLAERDAHRLPFANGPPAGAPTA